MRTLICQPLSCHLEIRNAPSSAHGVVQLFSRRTLPAFLALLLVPGLIAAAGQRQPWGAGGIKPINSSVRELSLRVSLPAMGVTDMLMQSSAPHFPAFAGGSGQLETGKPNVPVFGEWVLIPNGTRLSIRVDPGKPLIVENVDIGPVQPPKANAPGALGPQFTVDTATYSTDKDYPGILAEAGPVRTVRGQDCAIVWVYPYQYNPVTRQFSIYKDLEVKLEFDGDIRPISNRLRSAQFENVFARLALNADAVLSAQQQSDDRPGAPAVEQSPAAESLGNGETGGCDYLIICNPDFEIATVQFANWKRLSGFRTKIVTTDETGVTAEHIEGYIDQSQEDWTPAPSYVLLLGDAEHIPCFYMVTHAKDLQDYKYGLMQGEVASDRYYGDTNDDGVADIFVGRLPVDTAEEAKIALDRVMNYERTPPDPAAYADFYRNFTSVCFFEDYDRDGYEDIRFAKGSEDIYQYLTGAGYTGRRIYRAEPSTIPTHWTTWEPAIFENDGGGGQPVPAELQKPTFEWYGTRQDIDAAITNGLFLITHLGHGSRMYRYLDDYLIGDGGWATPYFSEKNAAALENGPLTPILWSPSCETGWFDNETDRPGDYYSEGAIFATLKTGVEDESFCEQLIVNPKGGAVGVIGSTRISYGPIVDRMVWGWMDAIWPDYIESCKDQYGDSKGIYQMGPVFEYGKQYMLTKFSDPNYSDVLDTTIDEFIWFGDPTMEIWTAAPEPLTESDVIHPASIDLGEPTDVTVTVRKASQPLADARVTISRAMAPEDYWTGLTNASGKVTFVKVTTSQWGVYNVVVTAHNYVPYEGIMTSAASGGSVTVVESQVSASEDDAYASSDSSQRDSVDFLRVGRSSYNPPPYYMSGMVFRNLNIPRGAEIISASLKLKSTDKQLTNIVLGKIEAEAADNAEALGISRHIRSLEKTNASVDWDLHEPWTENTWYSSPDISELIREVVNRQGWSANNSLTILYSTRQREGGYRSFASYDSNPDDAPKLLITYAGTGS